MCELGWKSLGVLELTALPSIDEALWVPVVRETDVLLVNGGDSLYLCYWMRQSGLADLLPELGGETVYMGLSAGSMVMAKSNGEDFVHWGRPPVAIERWDWLILRCYRTWITLICRTIPWPTVINTITLPKRAFMRQESKRAKLCVNHATQGLTLFHGLYPRQASLYPVFLSAPTWKRLPQPSQTGNKRKAQDTCKNLSLRVIFARILGLPQTCTVFRPDR